MRHSDSFGDPRTAARQVVEDHRRDFTALLECADPFAPSKSASLGGNAEVAALRILDLVEGPLSTCRLYSAAELFGRHTADQPLTSRRLREGR